MLYFVVFITFQMRETCLVEIFCELDLEVYDRAIGGSISKLAFEAVEKIIQVDWCYCNNLLV